MGIRTTLDEKGFTQAVIKAAKLNLWRVAHFRAARTMKGWRTPVSGDGKGFPDLVLIRGTTIIFAELKVGKNTLTKEQREWAMALEVAGNCFHVWTPEMWDEIFEVLKWA